MPYFMVSVYGEDGPGWNENVEVKAKNAYAAAICALMEIGIHPWHCILHEMHVGPAQEAPTTDQEMSSWSKEDWFYRLDAD